MLHVKITTPEGTVYDAEDVESITIPTETGIITVYEGHLHLMSLLRPGELSLEKATHSLDLVVSSGIVEIKEGNKVNLLVETAERVEELDLERAKEAHARAEKFMQEQESFASEEFTKVQAQILKELARIDSASKYQKKHSKS